MHYFAGVVVGPEVTRETAQAAVAPLMAPFSEELREWDEETESYVGEDVSFWDWWVVGGRWAGVWDPDYDVEKDPANIEPCRICHGTGARAPHPSWGWGPKEIEAYRIGPMKGCNGCTGTGKSLKWSSDWRELDADVMTVGEVLDRKLPMPHTLVLPDSGVFRRNTWTGGEFQETPEWEFFAASMLAPYRDAQIVVVDYHS